MRFNAFLENQHIHGQVVQIKKIGYNKLDSSGLLSQNIVSYVTELTFYENGKLKEQISYDSNGKRYGYDIQTFNKIGSQISLNQYDETGRLEETEILYYNLHDDLIKNKKIEYDGNKSSTSIYTMRHEYSVEGKLIKTTNYNQQNEFQSVEIFKYNTNGNLLSSETFTEENRLVESFIHKYDEFQNLIELRYISTEPIYPKVEPIPMNVFPVGESYPFHPEYPFGPSSTASMKPIGFVEKENISTYLYDGQGNRLEHKTLDHDGSYTIEKNIYDGNQLIETEVSNFDALGQLKDDCYFLNRARRVTKFNKNAGLTENEEYMADGKLKRKYHIETKYDEYFNIIEERHFTDDKLVSVQVYEITYQKK